MHRNKQNCELPSIKTRIRDKLYFPDKEMFFLSFRKIFDMPLILHYKNFYIEQINRTLTSKNKMFKFKLTDSNLCLKCNIISTTEHAIFECSFPKYFVHKLALFLDFKYNESKPEYIFLKENFYLFNMHYPGFSDSEYIQLTHLILIAKDRSLKFSTNDVITNWNENNFLAHSLLISQFTFKLLENSGIQNELVSDFLKFITC